MISIISPFHFSSLIVGVNGLFDFDLTFFAEGILFFFLSCIVTNFFLFPISKKIEERNEMLDFQYHKSMILFDVAQEKLMLCVDWLTSENLELRRQVKETRKQSTDEAEQQLKDAQEQTSNILRQLKKELIIQSIMILATVKNEIIVLSNNFVSKKFQSLPSH